MATAPGGHALSGRLSFGYFSLARQRKVTAAPRRGDANRPTRPQVLHENASAPPEPPQTTAPTRKGKISRRKALPIEPVANLQDACATLT
ncbi:hypothetical protein DIE22_29720 [Burkholderia sp. Bp9142]|nr:hypothetical protein DIE22_29720 [Burkholderia sp. Bp9142]